MCLLISCEIADEGWSVEMDWLKDWWLCLSVGVGPVYLLPPRRKPHDFYILKSRIFIVDRICCRYTTLSYKKKKRSLKQECSPKVAVLDGTLTNWWIYQAPEMNYSKWSFLISQTRKLRESKSHQRAWHFLHCAQNNWQEWPCTMHQITPNINRASWLS